MWAGTCRAGEDWGTADKGCQCALAWHTLTAGSNGGDSRQSELLLFDEAYLQALGHCVVDHKAHIGLVNPHACKQGKQQLSRQGTGHQAQRRCTVVC